MHVPKDWHLLHKITNGTINYMGLGIMIFRRGIDRTRGIGGLFWGWVGGGLSFLDV